MDQNKQQTLYETELKNQCLDENNKCYNKSRTHSFYDMIKFGIQSKNYKDLENKLKGLNCTDSYKNTLCIPESKKKKYKNKSFDPSDFGKYKYYKVNKNDEGKPTRLMISTLPREDYKEPENFYEGLKYLYLSSGYASFQEGESSLPSMLYPPSRFILDDCAEQDCKDLSTIDKYQDELAIGGIAISSVVSCCCLVIIIVMVLAMS